MSIAEEIAKLRDLRALSAIKRSEFEQAKAKPLTQRADRELSAASQVRLWSSGHWIPGVLRGIGARIQVASRNSRLLFVARLFAGGFTFTLYFLLWAFVVREGVLGAETPTHNSTEDTR